MPAPLTVEAVDRQRFDPDLRPRSVPVLMKGQVAHWPAVEAARCSSEAIGDYLKAFDLGLKTPVSVLPVSEGDVYFYDQTATRLNYRAVNQLLPDIIDRLIALSERTGGDRYYMQSLPVETFLPRFMQHNRLPLVAEDIRPRIWIGNRLSIQTHYDMLSNVACVVAGRRRFTLFPPAQLANLYPGPDDFTPGGTPVSMARLNPADFELFPRLKEALAHAHVAEMEPGDALYIPYGWWHNVESLSGFNVLVNYWWNDADAAISPKVALKAALLAVRTLPAEQRALWKAMFDYYVFETTGDPVAHLPPDARGNFGDLTAERAARLLDEIRASLSQKR